MVGSDQEGRALLGALRLDSLPVERRAGHREQRRAGENGAGIELRGIAESLQERRQRLVLVLIEQPLQRRTLRQDARRVQGVLGHPAHVLVGRGAREQHPRLALALGEAAQHADGGRRQSNADQQHQKHLDGGHPPRRGWCWPDRARARSIAGAAGSRALDQRRRYPVRSTSDFSTRVSTASSVRSEATANAPVKS